MNEKTKQILRYVSCGLGGLALGIGLLGGLSMCATSNRSTAESVNTIYANPKRAQITTDEGGFTGCRFSIPTKYPTTQDGYYYNIYAFEDETYTPINLAWNSGTLEGHNRSYVLGMINTAYQEGKNYQNANRTYRFLLAFYAFSNPYADNAATDNYPISYLSFIEPSFSSYSDGFSNANTAFVLTSNNPWDMALSLDSASYFSGYGANTFYFLTGSKQSFYSYKNTANDTTNYTLIFQDVCSYYQELGYQDGYSDGETAGNSASYTSGYNDGYEAGSSQGYENGYIDAYDDGYASGYTDGADNSLLFTKIGANQTAWSRSDITWDDSTDTTSTMKVIDFKDGENNTYYVCLVDYTVGGGEVQINVYKNGTASNNFYATIGRGDYNSAYTEIDIIPSSYLEFDFAQVITYYHNAIPNNWLMLSGTPANANGYQQGYQAGYRDGQMSTPSGQATDNVFALFTSAFNSIGGIFEMKIFGFLPLYWFFLTPIFIAIITLLLRMVKH